MSHYVEINVDYEGELHCRAIHDPSETVLETDAPVDNEGKGESFSPTDLVATALATCITTTVNIFAKRKGWDFQGMRVRIRKEMIMDPYRRIHKLEIEIWMPILLEKKERVMVEHTAHTCPVFKSINTAIHAPVIFHWPEKA